MTGIITARVVFTEATQSSDVVGPVSVGANGWVTLWRADNPEFVEAMYPPQSILLLAATAQEQQGAATDEMPQWIDPESLPIQGGGVMGRPRPTAQTGGSVDGS